MHFPLPYGVSCCSYPFKRHREALNRGRIKRGGPCLRHLSSCIERESDTVIVAQAQNMQNDRSCGKSPIAAVIVPCSGKKRISPPEDATAVSLPRDVQTVLQSAWAARVEALSSSVDAAALYSGRSFGLGRETALRFDARLFVISAGLGFVPGERRIPVYGLTISGKGPESVAAKVVGRFDPQSWWQAVSTGPYSVGAKECLDSGREGLVLVALTRPYAEMFGRALATAIGEATHRLRIFGRGVSDMLPAQIAPFVMPYDDRLDTLLPGTCTDYSHRALSHFANNIASRVGTAADHRRLVAAALGSISAPSRPERPRKSDGEIIARIQTYLKTGAGIGRTLRQLRDQDAIACEQSRFTRLYRMALEQRVSS